jgi:hypothetical protein
MLRMEDRIRRLCSEILATTKDEEVELLLVELREALRQHIERLRGRLSSYPFLVERRQRNYIPPPNKGAQEDTAKKADPTDVRS